MLVVLASHLSNYGLHLFPGFTLSGTGKSGVYLFFVLSAFLLTRILMDRPGQDYREPGFWADYGLRRVLRIWPLYLFVLALSWALTQAGYTGWHYQMDDGSFWRHLTLREGQSVLWSIPVEFTYYAFLPLVALALAWIRLRKPGIVAEVGTALGLLVAASLAWPAAQSQPNDVRLGPYVVIFLCGALAARLDLALREPGRIQRPKAWLIVAVFAVVALVLTTPKAWSLATGGVVQPALNHRWFLFFGLAWSALLLAVLHGPSWLRRPFEWVPMRWVGAISFSLYLWHMPVLVGLMALGLESWPLAPLSFLACAMAVAAASYLLFERPWRDVRTWRRNRSRTAS